MLEDERKDHVESTKSAEIVEKTLDLSEGAEEFAEVSVEVPPEESGNHYYRYTVKVNKRLLTSAVEDDTFMEFWKKMESIVMEDINKV